MNKHDNVTDDITPASVNLYKQIQRFLITGTLSAIVDFSLYLCAYQLAHWPIDIAKGISFIAGTTTAYLINRRWTFQASASAKRFGAVILLYGLTFGVQVGINHLCLEWLGREKISLIIAFIIAQGTATIINFIVQRTIIFPTPASYRH